MVPKVRLQCKENACTSYRPTGNTIFLDKAAELVILNWKQVLLCTIGTPGTCPESSLKYVYNSGYRGFYVILYIAMLELPAFVD